MAAWILITSSAKRLYKGQWKPIFHCNAKKILLGPRIGLDPQRHNFELEIQTCWYLKSPKFALLLTATPTASRWNIGGVGSLTQGAGDDFMLFVSFLVALGTQHKLDIQWKTCFTLLLRSHTYSLGNSSPPPPHEPNPSCPTPTHVLPLYIPLPPETLYHRDETLLYIAYVMLIWAAPIPADRWHCSL